MLELLEISSATNDVATLRRGILNTFERMLNIDVETPADASSKGPFQYINYIRAQGGIKENYSHMHHKILNRKEETTTSKFPISFDEPKRKFQYEKRMEKQKHGKKKRNLNNLLNKLKVKKFGMNIDLPSLPM